MPESRMFNPMRILGLLTLSFPDPSVYLLFIGWCSPPSPAGTCPRPLTQCVESRQFAGKGPPPGPCASAATVESEGYDCGSFSCLLKSIVSTGVKLCQFRKLIHLRRIGQQMNSPLKIAS